jgi:hypothetical protein
LCIARFPNLTLILPIESAPSVLCSAVIQFWVVFVSA